MCCVLLYFTKLKNKLRDGNFKNYIKNLIQEINGRVLDKVNVKFNDSDRVVISYNLPIKCPINN